MSYKVIEKNEYGIRVRNYSEFRDCDICKYHQEKSTCKRIECAPDSYYLPDSEVEKLESENQLMNTTIDDLYIESKCYFEVKKKLDDSQKELIDLQNENKQLKERIKELETTIENMKAIAGEKIEFVSTNTSVDYPNDNETEIYVFVPVEINYWKGASTYIHRKSFKTIEECQEFFDNIHKKDSGERWGTMLCDYRDAKWETAENGDLFMMVNHDGAIVEYICMKLGVK